MDLLLSKEIKEVSKTLPKIYGLYKCLNCGEEFSSIAELPCGLVIRSVCEKLPVYKINFRVMTKEPVYC